jgi:hypothetical protein
MTPQDSLEHLKGPVVEAFPLGVIVDRTAPDAAGRYSGKPMAGGEITNEPAGGVPGAASATTASPEPEA